MKNNLLIRFLKKVSAHISTKRKKQFLFLLLISVFSGFTEILSIAAVVPFVRSVTEINFLKETFYISKFISMNSKDEIIIVLGIIFSSLCVLNSLVRCLLIYVSAQLSNIIAAELSVKIYKAKLYDSYDNHISKSSNIIIAAVTQKVYQIQNVLGAIINFIARSFIFVAIIGVLIWINPLVTLMSIIFFAILYSLLIIFGKKILVRNSESVNNEQNNIVASLQDGLGAIRDIILDKTQNFYLSIFQKSSFNKSRKQAENAFIQQAPRYIFEGVGISMVVIFLIYFGSLETNANNFSLIFPTIAALAIGAQRILPLLNSLYVDFSQVRSNSASVEAAIEILNENLVKEKKNSLVIQRDIYFKNSILFNNVSFSYNKNKKYILENVNLEIRKGSRVGIVGKTGEGKSTLLDLLMGLLEVENGTIQVDGIELSEATMGSWQSKISHVPQKIFLSDDTYLSNIAFGEEVEKIDIEKVELASKQSQIHKFIMESEKGYYGKVGERGIKLSGGQMQRIGLARALYKKKAEIIIFDEATNSLDTHTEKLIMEELSRLDKNLTVVIVAHRLNTLDNCDTILEIKNKQIHILKN